MMTDRELLELAAKAAGIRHIEYDNDYDGALGLMRCDEVGRHTVTWNPLTDDGDALRLAVEMRKHTNGNVVAISIGNTRSSCEFHFDDGLDAAANTRRSIVMAAAFIGKAMP